MPDKPLYVLSLMTSQNLYQREQQAAAEEAARELGVDLLVLDADNDAVTQTQQLLTAIQDRHHRPQGMIVSAAGSAMPQVAQAAASSGVAWAMLNREIDNIDQLRNQYSTPIFMALPDHLELGRVMARQVAKLLPQGGRVLLLTGPSSGYTTQLRCDGFRQAAPRNIETRAIHGLWTRESGRKAVSSLLALSMQQDRRLELVAAHNDDMAMGAREAFQAAGAQWRHLAFTGIDGMALGGQAWVRDGSLAATQIMPTTADIALRAMAQANNGGARPPERLVVQPCSYPPLERLQPLAGVGV